jgi:hypothetical protein
MQYLYSRQLKILLRLLFLMAMFLIVGFFLQKILKNDREEQKIVFENKGDDYWNDEAKLKLLLPVADIIPPPPPPKMEKMKTNGCVADGLLNGYVDGADGLLKLISRSKCYYLHRSIETWLQAPDFEKIKANMSKIDKSEIVYGMFIAEAISTKAKYYYEAGEREFDFDRMCRPGSKNVWGEHTCKPSLAKKEYQRYVLDITKRAMDLGVQSFMFGQVFYQDYISEPAIGEVLEKMRKYAKLRGIEIVIGAQTNDIEDESYLRQFDFIEGGVGLGTDGTIEDGPCYSRWYKKDGDWCWALLWHNKFKSRANNVFAHLDWSGKVGDDMSTFSLMSKEERGGVLKYLDNYFTQRDVGFLMPMVAVLPKENGGCHGKSKKFYSADNKYSCDDEDMINSLLGK